MRVNIVVRAPDLPWIAGRLARELVARLPFYEIEAVINGTGKFDVEYQQIVYGPPNPAGPHTRKVGLFTHGEVRASCNAHYYDGHIALNPDIQAVLRAAGAPNPVVIEQAVDDIFVPKTAPIFGVAGSTKADGRKGEALVRKMLDAGYQVIAWGSGWPCPIVSQDYNKLPDFYRVLDYYVVTSRDEGGCTPIIECMAMGIPVISPRIGFAINRPVLEYNAGEWESLHRVLRYLTEVQTYDDWALQHANYFRSLFK